MSACFEHGYWCRVLLESAPVKEWRVRFEQACAAAKDCFKVLLFGVTCALRS